MNQGTDLRLSLRGTLRAQGRVIMALMLRDIQTRFGSAPAFAIAILWPLSHVFLCVTIYSVMGRAVPYGESPALWFASGLMPFMAFNYLSRFTMMSVVLNKPLLSFPIIKVLDIVISRAIIEILNACTVIIITLFILTIMGIDVMPADLPQAFCALGASIFLGVGFGIINGIIAGMFAPWVTGYALFQIIMWIASGVVLSPDGLPEVAKYWLSLNPALQGVEWMRSAYYDGLGEGVLDKNYMLFWAAGCLFIGLLLERVMRGKILK